MEDTPQNKIRFAVLQCCSGMDVAQNMVMLRKALEDAARAGAQWCLTPEMSVIMDMDKQRLKQAFLRDPGDFTQGRCTNEGTGKTCQDRILDAFSCWAKDLSMGILLGSTPWRDPRTQLFTNRCLVFSPFGECIARYDKIHLFDVEVDEQTSFCESAAYACGKEAVLVRLEDTAIGLSICYDVRFAALYRALAKAGAAILCVPAAFTVPTGQAHWECLLRARAIENGAWVIAAAQGGLHPDGRRTYGHSMVVDPWGRVCALLAHDSPGMLVVDIDPALAESSRLRIPSLEHGREFRCVEAQLATNTQRVREGTDP